MAKTKDKKAKPQPKSFFQERMDLLGITPELNKVRLWFQDAPAPQSIPVFNEDKNGNIEIMVWDLEARPIYYQKQTDSKLPTSDLRTFSITRLKNPIINEKGETKKYNIPKGVGTHPFIPPGLLDKFKKKEAIDTLILTEGYFKAFKGYMHGLDIIGLSSITHYKDKDTLQLHHDIIRIIKECKAKNVILLYDGDCRNLSLDALAEDKDISKRPNGFFASIRNIKELLKDMLKDYEVSLYFANVNSESHPKKPKGLDDLLVENKGKEEEIIKDILSFSKPCHYFVRENITFSLNKVQQYFHLNSVNEFYTHYSELLKNKSFTFFGTKYEWEEEKKECKVIIPGAAKFYFRVGDDYFKWIEKPNKHGQKENIFARRQKTTIVDDHGKQFVTHIPKYNAFCSVPDHVNYQQTISSCFNVYFPFDHQPEEGEWENTKMFLTHIFGEQYELGLDYVQLLFQKPTQILPIICLVSKENMTGKTKFAEWLKSIFKQNMTIVGNQDLADNFNAHWATKLLVCCDETKIDKQVVVERIKSLSTADRIMVNAKGRDQIEIDFYGKFILLSNNEENFIYASEDDIRYWVRKIPVIAKEKLDVKLIDKMISEIPAFLQFLQKRQLTTICESRMWFAPHLIKTEALMKVMKNSKSTLEKELKQKLRNMFLDFGLEKIYMTQEAISKEFFNNKYESNYLRQVIKDNLKIDYYKRENGDYVTYRHSFPKWDKKWDNGEHSIDRVEVRCNGRPFVFLREQFLTPEEIATYIVDKEHDEKNKKVEDDMQILNSEFKTEPKPDEQMDIPI